MRIRYTTDLWLDLETFEDDVPGDLEKDSDRIVESFLKRAIEAALRNGMIAGGRSTKLVELVVQYGEAECVAPGGDEKAV